MSAMSELEKAYGDAIRLIRLVRDTEEALVRVNTGTGPVWASIPIQQVEFQMPREVTVPYIQAKLDALRNGLEAAQALIVELTK